MPCWRGRRRPGYATQMWTLPRVRALIRKRTGETCHPGHVSRLLHAMGLSCQRPERRAIVFIDESGLSTRPHRERTWAPRGETPVLHETFNWKSLSVIAGITLWGFYFWILAGSIKSGQVVGFLKALRRHFKCRRLLVIRDGAPIHRSRVVTDYLATTGGRLAVERLPAYAPELNPAEYLWAHLKEHKTGNLIVREAWQLSHQATAALRRMRCRPCTIRAFFAHAELWP